MTFEPENELERSLIRAATDPLCRPQFYQDLARSDVFVIPEGRTPPLVEVTMTLQAGTTLQIKNLEHNGVSYVPIFSSLTRLQTVAPQGASYVRMNAVALLEITQGSAIWLNPGSDYGKQFTSEEASRIVGGTIGQGEQNVLQEPTEVRIGEPARYPTALVDALRRFFKTKKQVKRAWITLIQNPARDAAPHTLLALEVTDGFVAIVQEAGVVIAGIEVPDPPIDIVQLMAGNDLAAYFEQAKPFYRRSLLGLF